MKREYNDLKTKSIILTLFQINFVSYTYVAVAVAVAHWHNIKKNKIVRMALLMSRFFCSPFTYLGTYVYSIELVDRLPIRVDSNRSDDVVLHDIQHVQNMDFDQRMDFDNVG